MPISQLYNSIACIDINFIKHIFIWSFRPIITSFVYIFLNYWLYNCTCKNACSLHISDSSSLLYNCTLLFNFYERTLSERRVKRSCNFTLCRRNRVPICFCSPNCTYPDFELKVLTPSDTVWPTISYLA